MSKLNFFEKIKKRLWAKIVSATHQKSYYPNLYRSYWHTKFDSPNKKSNYQNYYTAIPNRGAGIGHQLANWIAGYWFARQFDLKFAHTAFSSQKWDQFLGFGENEISVEELLKKGFKKIELPLFDENNLAEVELQKKIIKSYSDQNVVFVAEQDQFYQDQFGVMNEIKMKFYNATARKNDQLVYSKDYFNIAIHVRRGDIVKGQKNKNSNLLMRWQDNSYFEKVLSAVVGNITPQKPIAIYLFSQGQRGDFPDFEKFNNIHFCLDMGTQDSFLHMVYADLLITSKSSFSYKPALLSNGNKLSPSNFWHGYPISKDWILVEDNGLFDLTQLKIEQ